MAAGKRGRIKGRSRRSAVPATDESIFETRNKARALLPQINPIFASMPRQLAPQNITAGPEVFVAINELLQTGSERVEREKQKLILGEGRKAANGARHQKAQMKALAIYKEWEGRVGQQLTGQDAATRVKTYFKTKTPKDRHRRHIRELLQAKKI